MTRGGREPALSSRQCLKEGTPNRFWEMEASSSPIPGEQTLAWQEQAAPWKPGPSPLPPLGPDVPPVMGVVGAVLTPAGSREPARR